MAAELLDGVAIVVVEEMMMTMMQCAIKKRYDTVNDGDGCVSMHCAI